MPALVEMGKIQTEVLAIPTTNKKFYFKDVYCCSSFRYDKSIDFNAYTLTFSSIQISPKRLILELSPNANKILFKLYSFKLLKPNWDGFGAQVPSSEVLKQAEKFLVVADENDLPFYFSAPGPNGEIVMEFKKGQISAEVYFEESESYEMILYDEINQIYSGDLNLDTLIAHFK